ncbi:uncharacterized protein LOC120825939 isoform X1 [Gasterosteus aculeatus]
MSALLHTSQNCNPQFKIGLTLCCSFLEGGRTFSDSDLLDVIGGDYNPEEGGGGLDLLDAFGPDPTVNPPKKPCSRYSGGRTFSDSDLLDVIGGDYNPEEGGGYQGGLLEKLNTIIKNQNQQLRLLKQLTPSSRFNDRRTR